MGSFGSENVIWDLSDLFDSVDDSRIQLVIDEVLKRSMNK